ncbi:ABC transporter ATP-binding protein [Mycobacterium sp. TNTM28]|uniref:ABC transporter ATP-binding protein n=1 Tax=[Mycobacterium] fortunisiensis TaxID=2600579 RepID=A0ABS6KSL6_9MYCO|nr:ABC transporter ATP-binding protein [[Mycobacterium] fortunisiensis]MBU9766642.1 ABC transporter ATP-binding protein [[Mycobacterium] fortunisiensis]
MTAAGITAAGISVEYPGGKTVLDRLDLTVPAGSFHALLGPSGCGKSTLLNCMAGFVRPSTGHVSFNGARITGPSRERGVVFQRDVLFPWATVSGNIRFALRAAKVPRAQRRDRIAELLDAVELPAEVATKLPHELSGGMRQRVGIARALANSPQVLLMDEPFGALDALTRMQMQDLAINLWEKTSTTIVFVTHDVDEAIRIASSIVIMGSGGTIVDQLDNPLPRPRPADRVAEFSGYAQLRRRLHARLRPDPGPITEPTGDHT